MSTANRSYSEPNEIDGPGIFNQLYFYFESVDIEVLRKVVAILKQHVNVGVCLHFCFHAQMIGSRGDYS
jgi:hypothetical protein